MEKERRSELDVSLDLISILKSILDQRRKVLGYVFVFALFGLLIAILSPKEFTAASTFIPRVNSEESGGGRLGGLAALAGISGMGSESVGGEIPPQIYPRIVASSKFKSALIQTLVKPEGMESSISYAEYYTEYYKESALKRINLYTIGLPGIIINAIKGSGEKSQVVKKENEGFIELTSDEIGLYNRINSQLRVGFNEKEGIVTIMFVANDPILASQMTKSAEVILQEEIKFYKLQMADQNLSFVEKRFEEKKKDFDQIQVELARFRDRNQNITSSIAGNELERLESDYNFKYDLYLEMAKQLEQAKLLREKDTPIFTVIQPVIKPYQKSAPNRLIILMGFSFLGLVIGVLSIFLKKFVTNFE